MKKSLFAIVAALMFAVNVKAQKYGPWDMFVGPRAGVVLNNFTSVDGDMETGLLLGVNAEVFFTSNISLNMGVSFTHQGCNDVQYGNIAPDETPRYYDYDLDYINTEFTVRYYPVSRFSVFTGIDFGRVVNPKIHGERGNRDISDYLHKGTVAFPVGMAVNYKNVELNVAYRYQVNKIGRGSFNNFIGDARNQSLMISMMYKIQLF